MTYSAMKASVEQAMKVFRSDSRSLRHIVDIFRTNLAIVLDTSPEVVEIVVREAERYVVVRSVEILKILSGLSLEFCFRVSFSVVDFYLPLRIFRVSDADLSEGKIEVCFEFGERNGGRVAFNQEFDCLKQDIFPCPEIIHAAASAFAEASAAWVRGADDKSEVIAYVTVD